MVMSDQYNVCSRVCNVKMKKIFLGVETKGENLRMVSRIERFKLFCAW